MFSTLKIGKSQKSAHSLKTFDAQNFKTDEILACSDTNYGNIEIL